MSLHTRYNVYFNTDSAAALVPGDALEAVVDLSQPVEYDAPHAGSDYVILEYAVNVHLRKNLRQGVRLLPQSLTVYLSKCGKTSER